MATAATAPSRRKRAPSGARTRKSAAGSRTGKATAGPAKTIKRAAKTAKGVRSTQRALPGKAGSLMTLGRALRLGRRLLKRQLPAATEALRDASDTVRQATEFGSELGFQGLAEQLRHVPVQLPIDVAVPVEVAYDEWMQLESLPEGDHRVEDIERGDGRSRLVGKVSRRGAVHDWEAEIRDERRDESFAWRSTGGSDVAGLVTFHRLGDRLTRLELQLDIVPTSASEALALALRFSDRLAEAELRRFKARVETISPDAYPARANHADQRAPKRSNSKRKDSKRNDSNRDKSKRSNHPNRRAPQGSARSRQSRNQSKED